MNQPHASHLTLININANATATAAAASPHHVAAGAIDPVSIANHLCPSSVLVSV